MITQARVAKDVRLGEMKSALATQLGLMGRAKMKRQIRPLCVEVIGASELRNVAPSTTRESNLDPLKAVRSGPNVKRATDPYVLVTVVTRSGDQLTRSEVKSVKGTQDPQWGTELVLAKAHSLCHVVFTVLATTSGFTKRPEFLGQVALPLGTLHYGSQPDVMSLPLLAQHFPVHAGDSAKPLKFAGMDARVQGRIQIQIRAQPLASSMCGYVSRQVAVGWNQRQCSRRYWAALANNKVNPIQLLRFSCNQ